MSGVKSHVGRLRDVETGHMRGSGRVETRVFWVPWLSSVMKRYLLFLCRHYQKAGIALPCRRDATLSSSPHHTAGATHPWGPTGSRRADDGPEKERKSRPRPSRAGSSRKRCKEEAGPERKFSGPDSTCHAPRMEVKVQYMQPEDGY